MNCIQDDQCPDFYACTGDICMATNFLTTDNLIIFCLFLIPLLSSFNNKFGLSSSCLIYLVFVDILSYPLQSAILVVAPVALGAGLSSLIFVLPKKQNDQFAINYYMCNILIPCLTVGNNIGLQAQINLPQIFPLISSILLLVVVILLLLMNWKQTRAEEKIQSGQLRQILPKRYSSPKKKKLTIQLPLIEERDGEDEGKAQIFSPTRKKQLRESILSQNKDQSQIKPIIVSILLFFFYQSLSFLLPHLFSLAEISMTTNFIITAMTMVMMLAIGEYYLYKFYIQPKQKEQLYTKLNFKLNLNLFLTIQLCLIGFLAAFIQGLSNVGYSQILIIYLLGRRINHQTIYTVAGYQLIFIGIMLTFITMSEEFPIKIMDYLIIASVTFFGSIMFTLIFDYFLFGNLPKEQEKSWKIIIIMIIIGVCFCSVCTGFGLEWSRRGWQYLVSFSDNSYSQ